MITPKIGGLIVAAFVAGTFLASPELRAYAANTVGSADIINNSIQSVDIKDGEVKAADIATDAVGAAELQGATKLLFGQCVLSSAENSLNIAPGTFLVKNCNISGVDADDSAVVTLNSGDLCFEVAEAQVITNVVHVYLKNDCADASQVLSGKLGVIVFDK